MSSGQNISQNECVHGQILMFSEARFNIFFALPALLIAIFWMAMAHEHRKGDQIY